MNQRCHPKNSGKDLVKRPPIVRSEDAEPANDQIRLDGGDDRLDDRWFQQYGRPPFDDSRLTDSGSGRAEGSARRAIPTRWRDPMRLWRAPILVVL